MDGKARNKPHTPLHTLGFGKEYCLLVLGRPSTVLLKATLSIFNIVNSHIREIPLRGVACPPGFGKHDILDA